MNIIYSLGNAHFSGKWNLILFFYIYKFYVRSFLSRYMSVIYGCLILPVHLRQHAAISPQKLTATRENNQSTESTLMEYPKLANTR